MISKFVIGGWAVDFVLDEDGHLTVLAKHNSRTEVREMELETEENEFGIRLTCKEIEEIYRLNNMKSGLYLEVVSGGEATYQGPFGTEEDRVKAIRNVWAATWFDHRRGIMFRLDMPEDRKFQRTEVPTKEFLPLEDD